FLERRYKSHGEPPCSMRCPYNQRIGQEACFCLNHDHSSPSESAKVELRCFDQALGCDPEAAAILNHVAWFRATTDAESYRNPQVSLKLVLRALKTCETFGTGYLPDILDTAARACYENGQYAKALHYEQDALRYEPHSHSYRDQLEMIRSKLGPLPAAP
ncbi:MAG TPA: hypothetical protein VMZ31_14370, partial [Phycisphaerae bacterium]|nr:hypothetical protein [Phycisphaerae bacterium]